MCGSADHSIKCPDDYGARVPVRRWPPLFASGSARLGLLGWRLARLRRVVFGRAAQLNIYPLDRTMHRTGMSMARFVPAFIIGPQLVTQPAAAQNTNPVTSEELASRIVCRCAVDAIIWSMRLVSGDAMRQTHFRDAEANTKRPDPVLSHRFDLGQSGVSSA